MCESNASMHAVSRHARMRNVKSHCPCTRRCELARDSRIFRASVLATPPRTKRSSRLPGDIVRNDATHRDREGSHRGCARGREAVACNGILGHPGRCGPQGLHKSIGGQRVGLPTDCPQLVRWSALATGTGTGPTRRASTPLSPTLSGMSFPSGPAVQQEPPRSRRLAL